ncbi:2-phospho-L-lactate guanylyltransferase [Microbacterium sp. VKM Ac-2923]|uniref:2-phospho-L-lactate guanylyltransferase n=1 Tax=Microbacterium sp. VKM Ac-2923 TaxID=2929476 RepID=UPI001FB1E0EE|nr:2-phospho-L-lactate guanylyltransferase [Microbacterium sp. VKM Ac-2923]MCJ1708318.1 2-phospho-L-lactate guanylyltransferase [Microbacterium sp. VKM Ac-2923]
MNTPDAAGWTIIIPVKPAAVGKSRLSDVGTDREALARAIALDTIAAAAAAALVARVIVVTDDAGVRAELRRARNIDVIPEGDTRGLDAAIALGAAAAGQDTPRAALLGDLPALRAADLDLALELAASVERGLVPDAEASGSTLVTARAGAVWVSAFGEDSAGRHRLLGCTVLAVERDSTLRRDVDTAAQLSEAVALGVGPRTSAVLAAAAA